MLYAHRGKRPTVDATATIAPNAVLCGDVRVGRGCAVAFGAVLSAEDGSIALGENCIVMENAVIRAGKRAPVHIGDHVLVGPRAYLTGCTIEEVTLPTVTTLRPDDGLAASSLVVQPS